ncbi:hypothetical protein BDV96DRAFT_651672 [Lophiotrema nucula]|uniref:PARP catalytic domain-containing protein n=1 Tax=Lophiotrema nucula TaxID=690887 RepID=A0A6A5YT77_9PLEO|nr:hypothetical protein BDV96DRAFT_651672 [Lophiotrema nucula]
MALRLSIPRLTSRSSKHDRQDSAIEIQVNSVTGSMDSLVVSTPALELPSPVPPAKISPSHKLLGRRHIKPHPKTLHELVSSAYQTTCSLMLRRGILSRGTNLIVTDPAVVDMLLMCISSVGYSRNYLKLELLPGCPVTEDNVKTVVDSLPRLSTLSLRITTSPTSTNSSTSTLPSPTSALSNLPGDQKNLLNWVMKSSFAHLGSLTAATNANIAFPSLERLGVKIFVVTQQPPNKELLFRCHSIKHSPFPVFHGTHPSRLPLILSQGLKNMSATPYQSNGRAMGKGVYLAADASTSLCYSFGANGWPNSAFHNPSMYGSNQNMRILLGCELAGYERGKGTYVVRDEGKVVVRFVFLVPGNCTGEPGYEVQQELEGVLGRLRGMRGG